MLFELISEETFLILLFPNFLLEIIYIKDTVYWCDILNVYLLLIVFLFCSEIYIWNLIFLCLCLIYKALFISVMFFYFSSNLFFIPAYFSVDINCHWWYLWLSHMGTLTILQHLQLEQAYRRIYVEYVSSITSAKNKCKGDRC